MRTSPRNRFRLLIALSLAVIAAMASGCARASNAESHTTSSTLRTGFTQASGGVMVGATPSNGGFLAVGWSSGATTTPRVWETDERGAWTGRNLGTAPGGLTAAAVGRGQSHSAVLVGTAYDDAHTKPVGALIFHRAAGRAWNQATVTNPSGMVYRLEDVTALAGAAGTRFVAVGAAQSVKGVDDGESAVALVSDDLGATWRRIDLPLPLGVSSGAAFGITSVPAESGTAGRLIAVGSGAGTGFQQALMWNSSDGLTWRSVSDPSFEMAGQNLQAFAVRSAGSTVLAAGANVAPGLGDTGVLQTTAVWTGNTAGKWSLFSAGASSETTRCSMATALGGTLDATGEPNGFLVAEETYDAADEFSTVGSGYRGRSAASLMFSDNGERFADVTSRVKDLGDAAVISAIAGDSEHYALVGMRKDGTCGVWVEDSALFR